MRVLIACEYSGRVRDAFLAIGHDAMSCDPAANGRGRPAPHGRRNRTAAHGMGLDDCAPTMHAPSSEREPVVLRTR
jgi:hypothetical protein